MTVGISGANLANKWLDMLSATAFTAPPASYLTIHIGDPGANGTANASAGDSSRKAITYASASAGSKSMNGTNPVWTNSSGNETLSHIAGWDASSTGNFLYSAALTASQAWALTNTFTLTSLSISFTPIAA